MDIPAFLDRAAEILWGPWTAVGVLLVGLYFSATTGFFQISRAGTWLRETCGTMISPRRRHSGEDGISSFQSATAALAGSLGTGNIIGVATALTLGGPGAIFWMWIAAALGSMTAYVENVLGIIYRRRDDKGQWIGGPMIYMERGLNKKWLASAFAVSCTLASIGMGNLTQVNSIAQSAQSAFGIPRWAVGAAVAAMAAPAVFGGITRAARLTEKLVPVMAGLYLLACAAVLIMHIDRVPQAMWRIVSCAFTPAAAGGGALGAMLIGVRRGIFTNEAGLGSSVMVHCCADVDKPETQGMWSIFEVFLDTIVVCTLTALVLLVSGAYGSADAAGQPLDGAQLSAAGFDGLFGRFSGTFVTISLLLFAFATVIAWSCYGERAFVYLFGTRFTPVYKAVYIAAIIFGSVSGMRAVWAISDLLNAGMMLPNIAAIVILWHSLGKERLGLLPPGGRGKRKRRGK